MKTWFRHYWWVLLVLFICLLVAGFLFGQIAKENSYLEAHPELLPPNYQEIVR